MWWFASVWDFAYICKRLLHLSCYLSFGNHSFWTSFSFIFCSPMWSFKCNFSFWIVLRVHLWFTLPTCKIWWYFWTQVNCSMVYHVLIFYFSIGFTTLFTCIMLMITPIWSDPIFFKLPIPMKIGAKVSPIRCSNHHIHCVIITWIRWIYVAKNGGIPQQNNLINLQICMCAKCTFLITNLQHHLNVKKMN